MSRLIPLTRGQFAIVDDEDFEFLAQWKWHALKQPKTHYAARTVKIEGRKTTIWMHRLINGTPDGSLTDHINGDGLDNRRENLRSVTHQDNMINCARHVSGSSRFRGVSWHIRQGCWIAQITVDRKNIYLGRFSTELAAHEAYTAARGRLRAGKIIRMEKAA
jgi:hypothetical protein